MTYSMYITTGKSNVKQDGQKLILFCILQGFCRSRSFTIYAFDSRSVRFQQSGYEGISDIYI